jgi:pimeloyl-ACP methyl ester carboxylesterase
MATPVILIVPGGFTPPEAYTNIVSRVVEAGHAIEALHLPSIGYKTNIPGTMQDDAAFVASEITKHADEGKDVILVAHSYGGLPATESTKGLSKVDRERQGKPGGLVRLAYISCVILPVGEFDASVIMPDNMMSRGSSFEIRVDVRLACAILPILDFRAYLTDRTRVGCIIPIIRQLLPTSSTTCPRRRLKSWQGNSL